MATIFHELKSPSLAIDGTADHVHTLFVLGRTTTVADIVEEVKTVTSKWIKTKGREFRNFHWQKGYGAFSIGQSQVEAVKRYIGNQKHHHRKMTFQDEFGSGGNGQFSQDKFHSLARLELSRIRKSTKAAPCGRLSRCWIEGCRRPYFDPWTADCVAISDCIRCA